MAKWDRTTAAIWAVCGLLVIGLGGRWLLSAASSGGSTSPDPIASPTTNGSHPSTGVPREGSPVTGTEGTTSATGHGGLVVVDVAGRVRRPGVYRLPKGARVYQAIRMAGGAIRPAETASINLAAVIVDGSQIAIGRAALSGSAGSVAQGMGGGPVSLSTATLEQLDKLDGIGPALAQRIIDWRSSHGGFRSVADLDQVSGIGPAKLEALKSQVVP